MSGPSIQELLGLPADVNQPNAYQLFGLELGESDPLVIDRAIKTRIIALKKAKADAGPEVWKRAAVAVQAAQRSLQDPKAKAELDASFGIINEPEPAPTPASALDPLAALLPSSGSAATSSNPASPPNQPAALASVPAGPTAAPAATPTQPPAPPNAIGPGTVTPGAGDTVAPQIASAPVIRRRTPIRRRRSLGGLVFGTLFLVLLASLVGGLGYFYMRGPGKVEFVKTNDGFQIRTGGQGNSAPAAAPPMQKQIPAPAPKSDGIMKPPSKNSGSPPESLASDIANAEANSMQPNNAMQPTANAPSSSPPMDQLSTVPPATAPESDPAPEPAPPTMATPSPKAPTPETISIGKVAIDKARAAIRAADWEMMKPLAEMAESMAVTPEQKQLAETIYQYADLATYYRGAILRAVPALPTNSEIKITDSIGVLVNEADENHLKINRGKDASGKPQLYNYPIDEIPLIIVHAIAPYQLDIDSPEGQAAKAAYQAVWPKATPGVREQSVQIFRSLQKVEGADPQRLADFLATLNE